MWFWLAVGGVFSWGVVNVLDSLLVRHYEKRVLVLTINQSCFSLLVLLPALFFVPLPTSWLFPLLAAGICAYCGDVVFWITLEKVDVSVTNIAWAILAVLLAGVGFFFYGESWTLLQWVGALGVLIGVLVLSLWDRRALSWSAFGLLCAIAMLYMPFYAVQKGALHGGVSVLSVFYWPILAREVMAATVSLLSSANRKRLQESLRTQHWSFYLLNATVILFFFLGTGLLTMAYDTGPLSLIAVINNIQPFFVLGLAWIFVLVRPSIAPKELLTAQSVRAKLAGFCIVFLGLAFLTLSP